MKHRFDLSKDNTDFNILYEDDAVTLKFYDYDAKRVAEIKLPKERARNLYDRLNNGFMEVYK